jgi:hypothetical protein
MSAARAVLTVVFAVRCLGTVYGAFLDVGWSARAAGAGGAFVAGLGCAADLHGNPAGIVDVPRVSGEFSAGRLDVGVPGPGFDVAAAAVAFPAGPLSLGVACTIFDAAGMYREWRWAGTFAASLREWYGGPDVAVAVSAAFLGTALILETREQEAVSGMDTAAAAGTLDAGVRWRLNERLTLGCALRNASAADVSLAGGVDTVPPEARIGAAVRPGDVWVFEEMRIACDVGYRDQDWGDAADRWRWALGAEAFLHYGTVALRAGVSDRGVSAGTGVSRRISGALCAGCDYAVQLPYGASGSPVTHRLSLTVELR